MAMQGYSRIAPIYLQSTKDLRSSHIMTRPPKVLESGLLVSVSTLLHTCFASFLTCFHGV